MPGEGEGEWLNWKINEAAPRLKEIPDPVGEDPSRGSANKNTQPPRIQPSY